MAEETSLYAAMAAAQAEFTPVPKNRVAKVRTKAGGEYQYRYADLADILKMAVPVLAKHGIAFSQPLRRIDGHLCVVTCLFRGNETLLSDGIAIPNNLEAQVFGSYLTYWRRYDATSLLGIAADEDDDGKMATESTAQERQREEQPQQSNGQRTISQKQAARMFAIAKSKAWDTERLRQLIASHGFEHSDEIRAVDYDAIIAEIV